MELPVECVPVLEALGVVALAARHTARFPDFQFELPVRIVSALDVEFAGTVVGIRMVEGQQGHLLVDRMCKAAAGRRRD